MALLLRSNYQIEIMPKKARLYLLPVPIDDCAADTIPPATTSVLYQIKFFLAERSKTARKFIKMLGHPLHQNDITLVELDKHGAPDIKTLQSWLDAGNDVGLMSESGCPVIADPGAEVIQWAHRSGYEVVPLVGPSSILLALMASGFNGQSFVFHGYLPNKKEELVKKVKLLEQNAGRLNQSQIFIETPYRNLTMYDILVSTLQPNTHLSIHMGLTGPHAYSKSKTVKEWRKLGCSELRKDIPAIYIIG